MTEEQTEKPMDWDNYVRIFTLPIKDINVRKEVSKADVLMSLMSEGDIAFKLKGQQMVIKIDKRISLSILKQIIWKPIEEYVKQQIQEGKKQ